MPASPFSKTIIINNKIIHNGDNQNGRFPVRSILAEMISELKQLKMPVPIGVSHLMITICSV